MESPTSTEIEKALATVVRRQLVRGKTVELPSLGTLEVQHEKSALEETPRGETVLHPPKDQVVFTSEA